ncbi:MAG: hypothetical protein CMF46_02760 [Legionellales bacterium]|nr:hypothetical protein [Legionellales bacterium]
MNMTLKYLSILLVITSASLVAKTQELSPEIGKIVCQNRVPLHIHPGSSNQQNNTLSLPDTGIASTENNGQLTLSETREKVTGPAILEVSSHSLDIQCKDKCHIIIGNTANTTINLDMSDLCHTEIDGIARLNHVKQKHSSQLTGQWIDTRQFHYSATDNASAKLAGFIEFASFDIQKNSSIDISDTDIKKAWVKTVDNAKIGLRPLDELYAYSGGSSRVYFINRAKLSLLTEDSNDSRILWINPTYLDEIYTG